MGVDERQESRGAERLVVEVEGAEEAEGARQHRPHPNGTRMHISHCT